MPVIDHPGGYRFLPGIAPYSCGVVSAPGLEIVHGTLDRPVPVEAGFEFIEKHLRSEGRPRAALCAIELRSPKPFSFDGFADFNAGYARVLDRWGLFVSGVNPIARTNVAPEIDPPAVPSLFAFSYTRPCDASLPPTFVVAGAGELPEGVLEADSIVRAGETSPDSIEVKARFVMDLMERRLRGLGFDWSVARVLDIYTIHDPAPILPGVVLSRVGSASLRGVHWYHARPPIVGIEYEMDVRGVRAEAWLT